MFRPLTTIFLATLCLHLPAAQGESVPEEKTDVIPIAKSRIFPLQNPDNLTGHSAAAWISC